MFAAILIIIITTIIIIITYNLKIPKEGASPDFWAYTSMHPGA